MPITFKTKMQLQATDNQDYKSTEAIYYCSYATAVLMQFQGPETTPYKSSFDLS